MQKILSGKNFSPKVSGKAFASTNIALCKYWGKRDEELNLPVTSSLSVSLAELGTLTQISIADDRDVIFLNGKEVTPEAVFARRISSYLDLFRRKHLFFFKVDTQNTIPTAAGLASSASGFAALALALDDFFRWGLSRKELSILARLGSGSACRSVCTGFVEWHAGKADDGMDSYAEPMTETWPDLRVGVLTLSHQEKALGSREAMQRTALTSELYKSWPEKARQDLEVLNKAIKERYFDLLGQTAESNALAMHASMMAAWPPVLYWLPETIAVMQKVWQLRQQGQAIYFTIDAGPNVKLLFPEKLTAFIARNFLGVKIVAPFEN